MNNEVVVELLNTHNLIKIELRDETQMMNKKSSQGIKEKEGNIGMGMGKDQKKEKIFSMNE